jgi:hypothetical protein
MSSDVLAVKQFDTEVTGEFVEFDPSALGPDDPGPDDPTTDPRYPKARQLREGGSKVRDTCRRAGISMSTYYKWFPNPKTVAVQEAQQEMIDDMLAKRKAGWSDAAIARHHKRSRQWVWAMMGPRAKPAPGERAKFSWVTTRDTLRRVEQVAQRAGAANIDRNSNIGTMLDMIANGQLVVTAPPRPKPKERDGSSEFARRARSSRSNT